MTSEDLVKFRERLASVRRMLYPGAYVQPVQEATLRLMFDVIEAVLADQDERQ